MSRQKQGNQQQTQSGSTEKPTPTIPIIAAIIGALGLIIVALINRSTPFIPIQATQTAEAKLQNILSLQTPTVISPGNKVFEINFSSHGEGNCNNYDPQKLGYDTDLKVYYIIPDGGYVAVCHKNDNLPPEGVLQATAFPDEDSDYFGYAVFFGWGGTETKSTDACGFGIRKNNSITEALFIQIIGGNWNHSTIKLENFELDISPHSVRIALFSSGKAIGYLDGNYVAEHTFVDCQSGPVGLIAYGPGEVKINFTNLKLFALP